MHTSNFNAILELILNGNKFMQNKCLNKTVLVHSRNVALQTENMWQVLLKHHFLLAVCVKNITRKQW